MTGSDSANVIMPDSGWMNVSRISGPRHTTSTTSSDHAQQVRGDGDWRGAQQHQRPPRGRRGRNRPSGRPPPSPRTAWRTRCTRRPPAARRCAMCSVVPSTNTGMPSSGTTAAVPAVARWRSARWMFSVSASGIGSANARKPAGTRWPACARYPATGATARAAADDRAPRRQQLGVHAGVERVQSQRRHQEREAPGAGAARAGAAAACSSS